MEIKQTRIFKSTYKRLFLKHRKSVDHAIRLIIENPSIGEQKKSDLSEVFVYKFKVDAQLYLLAYTFDPVTLTLIMLGVHENFYRDLKRMPYLKNRKQGLRKMIYHFSQTLFSIIRFHQAESFGWLLWQPAGLLLFYSFRRSRP